MLSFYIGCIFFVFVNFKVAFDIKLLGSSFTATWNWLQRRIQRKEGDGVQQERKQVEGRMDRNWKWGASSPVASHTAGRRALQQGAVKIRFSTLRLANVGGIMSFKHYCNSLPQYTYHIIIKIISQQISKSIREFLPKTFYDYILIQYLIS